MWGEGGRLPFSEGVEGERVGGTRRRGGRRL